MEKELFIIRHGETDYNRSGIVQGRGVNPSLNEIGRKQALLFHRYYKNEPFEIIYTSTLKRTHESVIQFIEKGIPWEQYSELDEISWGIFEGKPSTHEFKMAYRQLVNDWHCGKLDRKSEQGESPIDLHLRQKKFIDHILSQQEKKILICMHGRAMRIFLPTLLKQDLKKMDDFPHHNLTLYKVNYQKGIFRIDLFNNMDHLHSNGKD